MPGVSEEVGKAKGKSSKPPGQKGGILLSYADAAGAIHVGTSVVNKVININYNPSK